MKKGFPFMSRQRSISPRQVRKTSSDVASFGTPHRKSHSISLICRGSHQARRRGKTRPTRTSRSLNMSVNVEETNTRTVRQPLRFFSERSAAGVAVATCWSTAAHTEDTVSATSASCTCTGSCPLRPCPLSSTTVASSSSELLTAAAIRPMGDSTSSPGSMADKAAAAL